MKGLIAALSIATLLLPLLLEQAYSQQGIIERSVTLKITNSKNGAVITKVWNITGYTFGEKSIDVSDRMLKKIKHIFNTDSFSFTYENKVFKGKWLYYKAELIGTPLVGKGLTIKFM